MADLLAVCQYRNETERVDDEKRHSLHQETILSVGATVGHLGPFLGGRDVMNLMIRGIRC